MAKMKHIFFKRRFIGLLAALILAAPVLWASGQQPKAVAAGAENLKNEIVFVSDTQSPIFLETLRLASDRNKEAMAKVLDRIVTEPDLAAVFMLGDLTSSGSTDKKWRTIDGFLGRLRNKAVPVFAALGNHDYWWSEKAALDNFRKRFPGLTSSWYSIVIGPVEVIVLNSQFKKLTDVENQGQLAFYRSALARADADPAVKCILVACHNPPYTNSQVVDPSATVRADFVPPFLGSKKGLLFLSGHAHASEHFLEGGKHFVVLGGGGGLLHPLRTEGNRYFPDLFPSRAPKRFYHFVTVRIEKTGLAVAFQLLKRDMSGFDPAGQFSIAW